MDYPLKKAAGLIHGADTYRANQVILTGEVQMGTGEVKKVAMPNSGAEWRDLQKEIARGLGFEPLDPPHSGDKDCHAEENLGWWLTLHPRSKLLGWAISRGRGGTSAICTACKKFALYQKWPPDETRQT
jgi:hypothetical protein